MKRLIYFSLFVFLSSGVAWGQQLYESDLVAMDQKIVGQKVTFKQVADKVAVSYSLLESEANVSMYVSLDAGQTWYGPLQQVSGDVGFVRKKGRKVIVWDALEEFGEIESSKVAFYVLARSDGKSPKLPKPKTKLPVFQANVEGIMSPSFAFAGIGVNFGMNKIAGIPLGFESGLAFSAGTNPSSIGVGVSALYGIAGWLYPKLGLVYNRFNYKDAGYDQPWKTRAIMGNVGVNVIIASRFVVSAGVWISPAIKGYRSREETAAGVVYRMPVPATYHAAGVWPHIGVGVAF